MVILFTIRYNYLIVTVFVDLGGTIFSCWVSLGGLIPGCSFDGDQVPPAKSAPPPYRHKVDEEGLTNAHNDYRLGFS